jgi:hypothetical protein
VYYESVSGTQYKSAWIFDTSDIWQLFPRIQSNDTTQSTSASTGSVVLLGGIGVAKNAWVGGALVTQPVTFSALPTCNAGIQGARAFVTDQNTAVAYHGAVSGSGTGKQGVTCDGTAWYQD